LSEGLSIVLLGEDTRGVRRCAAVVTATAGTAAASNALASLTPLHEALQPLPCRLSTQQLIDLLKHPLCVGQSRRIVLDQLENRYASKFADHWNFVRFAREQNLNLDFTTPPRLQTLTAEKR